MEYSSGTMKALGAYKSALYEMVEAHKERQVRATGHAKRRYRRATRAAYAADEKLARALLLEGK